MSANVELTRRGFAAFSRGDFDEALADMHREIEWHVAFRLPDLPPGKDVYRGHDEVRELWSTLRGVWDSLTLDMEEVLHDADDVLVLQVRFVGRGSGSGVEVDRTLYYLLTLQDEQLLRVQPFDSEGEARRAGGLDD